MPEGDAIPVVAGDLVLVAARDGRKLVALELATGERRFELESTALGNATFGAPTASERGGFLVPAFRDREVVLLRVGAGGGIAEPEHVDFIERGPWFTVPEDLLRPPAEYADGAVVAYGYGVPGDRQSWQLTDHFRLRWTAGGTKGFIEEMLAVTPRWVITRDTRGEQQALTVGRNRTTGERVWEHPARFAGVAGDVVLLDPDLLAGRRVGSLPTTLLAITAGDSGAPQELWRHAIAGELVSLRGAPHVVCVIEGTSPASGRLVRIATADGHEVASTPLDVKESFARPVETERPGMTVDRSLWPAIVGVDHTHVLWADRRQLVCERLAEAAPVWQLPLPAPCRPIAEDVAEARRRESHPAIVATGECVVLRAGAHVWAYAIDGGGLEDTEEERRQLLRKCEETYSEVRMRHEQGRRITRGVASARRVLERTPLHPDPVAWLQEVLRGMEAARGPLDDDLDDPDGYMLAGLGTIRRATEEALEKRRARR